MEIRSYRSVFELERRIYRVDRLRLNPTGVPVRGVVYALALIATVLICARLPLLRSAMGVLPWYLLDLALPVGAAALLTVVRIDGRPFHLAAGALARHRLTSRSSVGLRSARVGSRHRSAEHAAAPGGPGGYGAEGGSGDPGGFGDPGSSGGPDGFGDPDGSGGPGGPDGPGSYGAPGDRWWPPEVLLLPDGSDAAVRRLRYRGPGAVLVTVPYRCDGGRGGLSMRRGRGRGRVRLRELYAPQTGAGAGGAPGDRAGAVIALAADATLRAGR